MKSTFLLSIFIFFSVTFSLQAQSVKRVEPPFWWTGMNDNTLQLMIYGNDIQGYDISSTNPGVYVKAQHRLDNNNYLFLDLVIAEDAEPGFFDLYFEKSGELLFSQRYQLKERQEGSAERASFDASDVIYLLTPDRFANGDIINDKIPGMLESPNRLDDFGRHGGDLQGIIDHLAYIVDMGFSALWLNPVLENDQPEESYHGYAITNFYKIDPRFGSNEDYVTLSRLAKKRNVGLIMDVVLNHCGSKHWWMNDLPSKDWINNGEDGYVQTNHRKMTLLDPYVSDSDRKQMVEGWFVPHMPDLNQNNPYLANYLIQNTIWWIEYADLYGLRVDTYSYPFEEFMAEWSCAVMNEYPNFNIVAEEWYGKPSILGHWQEDASHANHGSCLPSLCDFPLSAAIVNAIKDTTNEHSLDLIYETLGEDFNYSDAANLVIFPDNHDMSRVYTQLDEDYARLKMAMRIFMTMRGIPQIFYGTEILMSNPGTESHGVIRSDFPGGWVFDSISAFTGIGMDSLSLDFQEWTKSIIEWRNNTPVIHNGDFMHYAPENGTYVYFRYDNENVIMVIVNKNTSLTGLDMDRFVERTAGFDRAVDVFSDKVYELSGTVPVQGMSTTVLRLENEEEAPQADEESNEDDNTGQ